MGVGVSVAVKVKVGEGVGVGVSVGLGVAVLVGVLLGVNVGANVAVMIIGIGCVTWIMMGGDVITIGSDGGAVTTTSRTTGFTGGAPPCPC